MPLARLVLATLHLIALGIGLGAVWTRARALHGPFDRSGLARIFAADIWWGVAAALWISTGLVRALGPFEKGREYYLHNHFFLAKMALLLVILALEVRPMVTLIRWRALTARAEPIDVRPAAGMARTSYVQAVLVICMVASAAAMARGFGSP